MNPVARRETWELIKKAKQGKTIIVTTQQIDEAEYLGDRVTILSNGKLECCGSLPFL